VVVWRSGNALVSVNEVNLRWVQLVLGWLFRLPEATLYFGM